MTYNLLEERWIPVLATDGKARRVGIRAALTEAGHIRQIAASNPMDNVALLRLLLAVLQWCKGGVSTQERERLWAAGARGVPESWLEKLDRNGAKFHLLGDGPRLYQAASEADETPKWNVAALFCDLPGGTEINHFRHVYDRTVALCPACCAIGLARLPACTTAGGRGLSPSINNAPPIYFLPVGDTLLGTWLLNWPMETHVNDHPAWEQASTSGTAIGVLEGLTWQPRTVWLAASAPEARGTCPRCGARGPLVSRMVFKKGRKRADDIRDWRDPHVAWDEAVTRDDKALRPPDPLKYSQRATAFWREEARVVLASLDPSNHTPPIPALRRAIPRLPQHSPLRVSCFASFTKPGQDKWFDDGCHMWGIHSRLLANAGVLRRALAELGWLRQLEPRKTVQQALRRNARTRPELAAAQAHVLAEGEERFRGRFLQLLEALAHAEGNDSIQRCVHDWREGVTGDIRDELAQACGAIALGSPLRRRGAVSGARSAITRALQRVPPDQPGSATPPPLGRTRGKGDGS